MGLVAAGPQFQALMGLPPSVVPTKRVLPVWMGVRESALAVALVFPRRLLGFPTTVMTPLASTDMPTTYLEACVWQALGKAALTSACEAEVMVSVTAVLH